jgi:hypothetical protein
MRLSFIFLRLNERYGCFPNCPRYEALMPCPVQPFVAGTSGGRRWRTLLTLVIYPFDFQGAQWHELRREYGSSHAVFVEI